MFQQNALPNFLEAAPEGSSFQKIIAQAHKKMGTTTGRPHLFMNADGETRTRKAKPHAPQTCAYTNSATSARYLKRSHFWVANVPVDKHTVQLHFWQLRFTKRTGEIISPATPA
jgi:hypothetical protein